MCVFTCIHLVKNLINCWSWWRFITRKLSSYNILHNSPCLKIYLLQNDGNMLKMKRLCTSLKLYCVCVKPERDGRCTIRNIENYFIMFILIQICTSKLGNCTEIAIEDSYLPTWQHRLDFVSYFVHGCSRQWELDAISNSIGSSGRDMTSVTVELHL